MKKQLFTVASIVAFSAGSMFAQTNRTAVKNTNATATATTEQAPANGVTRCSATEPGAEWDAWFNQKVAEFVQEQEMQKASNNGVASMPVYTIPVVVHVIHSGEAVGTGSNISNAQIQSQIDVLNQDYAGIGLNSNNVPYYFNGAKADCQIQFCLATIDKNGNPMANPGIDRVAASSIPVTVPGTGLTTATIDGTIKPATIWDPTKYCNMWVLKIQNGLLGYATFPAGSTLAGVSGVGTNQTDGLVMLYSAFGVTTAGAPYNKGRTTTHEIGHWLGLRHIWGDNGQCGATDYCVDTPPQKGQTNSPAGCYYGAPTYPSQPSSCTRPDGLAGASITNVHGDMFMNFMDYTDDAAMYMFTNDQKTRIQTAMANGTYRKFLGTHGLCSSSGIAATAPVAGFDWERTIAVTNHTVCAGTPSNFKDASRFYPTTWAWSVTPATGVTISSASSQNPQITFPAAGTYSVTLVASNGTGSNTKTQAVTVVACSAAAPVAAYTMASTGCAGTSVGLTNTSTGTPTPTYVWSANPSTGVTFAPSTTAATSVTFANPGTYTVSLVATNTSGNNTVTHTITVNNCSTGVTCPDTLSALTVTDTLTVLNSGNGGYVSGNNAYDDREKGQYFSSTSLTGLTSPQITGGIVLFYRNATNNSGTKGTANISINLYNGNNTTGPAGAAVKTQTVAISTITALTPVQGVTYCGDPNLGFASSIIYPYSFNFASPQAVTGDFIMSVALPANGTDTAVVFQTSGTTEPTPTAWEKWNDNSWHSYNDGTTATWQSNSTLAILPKFNCTIGINENNVLANNMALFPNPSNGMFNFATTLPSATDLSFNVVNTLGQTVFTKVERNVTSNIIGLDLTTLGKGVYMISITSKEGDKVTRKVIIE